MRKIVRVEYVGETNHKLGFFKGKKYLGFTSKQGGQFMTTHSKVGHKEMKNNEGDWWNANFKVEAVLYVKNNKQQTQLRKDFLIENPKPL